MGLMARYPAVRNDNGTFSIRNVPIFGELAEGERGNAKPIDRKWMQSAIDQAKLRQGEGYKYRLHILHHDSSTKPQPAGEFNLTKVRPLTYEGRRMDVLHADFLNVPEHVFDAIQRGELLYRSVEINNIKGVPEIDSVALLSTETPFFRLPVTDGETVTLEGDHQLAGTVAFQASGDKRAVLFRDTTEKQTMKTATLKVVDGALELIDEGGAVFNLADSGEPSSGHFVCHTTDGAFSAKFEDEKKDESDEVKKLKATIAKLRKQLEDKGGEKKDEEKMSASLTADTVKMQARLDVLESQAAERNAKDKADQRFKNAMSDLKDAGWHVPDRCVNNIKKFAAIEGDALDSYIEEFKATRPKDPRSLSSYIDEESTVPDEVLKFKAHSPDDYERAAKLAAEYEDELVPAGFGNEFTLAEFLDLRMKDKE